MRFGELPHVLLDPLALVREGELGRPRRRAARRSPRRSSGGWRRRGRGRSCLRTVTGECHERPILEASLLMLAPPRSPLRLARGARLRASAAAALEPIRRPVTEFGQVPRRPRRDAAGAAGPGSRTGSRRRAARAAAARRVRRPVAPERDPLEAEHALRVVARVPRHARGRAADGGGQARARDPGRAGAPALPGRPQRLRRRAAGPKAAAAASARARPTRLPERPLHARDEPQPGRDPRGRVLVAPAGSAATGSRSASSTTASTRANPFLQGAGFSYPAGFPKGGRPWVNGKIIVARAFPGPDSGRQGREAFVPRISFHGTHVAGIAAGNAGTFAPAGARPPRDARALRRRAPRVDRQLPRLQRAHADRLRGATPPRSSQAFESAVEDGMDVLNFSGGGAHGRAVDRPDPRGGRERRARRRRARHVGRERPRGLRLRNGRFAERRRGGDLGRGHVERARLRPAAARPRAGRAGVAARRSRSRRRSTCRRPMRSGRSST